MEKELYILPLISEIKIDREIALRLQTPGQIGEKEVLEPGDGSGGMGGEGNGGRETGWERTGYGIGGTSQQGIGNSSNGIGAYDLNLTK